MVGNGPFLAEKPNFEKAIQNQIQGRGADDRASPRTGCDPRARARGSKPKNSRRKKAWEHGSTRPLSERELPGLPGLPVYPRPKCHEAALR